jgi:hypothetical protein
MDALTAVSIRLGTTAFSRDAYGDELEKMRREGIKVVELRMPSGQQIVRAMRRKLRQREDAFPLRARVRQNPKKKKSATTVKAAAKPSKRKQRTISPESQWKAALELAGLQQVEHAYLSSASTDLPREAQRTGWADMDACLADVCPYLEQLPAGERSLCWLPALDARARADAALEVRGGKAWRLEPGPPTRSGAHPPWTRKREHGRRAGEYRQDAHQDTREDPGATAAGAGRASTGLELPLPSPEKTPSATPEADPLQNPHKERPIRVGASVQTSGRSPQIWPHAVIAKCPTRKLPANWRILELAAATGIGRDQASHSGAFRRADLRS